MTFDSTVFRAGEDFERPKVLIQKEASFFVTKEKTLEASELLLKPLNPYGTSQLQSLQGCPILCLLGTTDG